MVRVPAEQSCGPAFRFPHPCTNLDMLAPDCNRSSRKAEMRDTWGSIVCQLSQKDGLSVQQETIQKMRWRTQQVPGWSRRVRTYLRTSKM